MPDRDNWTAAMVLRWVLTRDQAGVLAMVDAYGRWGVFEDNEMSLLMPEDIDAVTIAYCIEQSSPTNEERAVTAVVRSECVIAAKDEIYRALRRGNLKARARRNGTGDIEKIAPDQWLGLKLQSWNGHDLAVPIDVEQNTLHPRPPGDYLTGRVPIDTRPVVWPDPHLRANQVMEFWPSGKTNRESVGVAKQAKLRENETTADRDLRWYDDFKVRRKSGSYWTNEAIFDAMSRDEFRHSGKAGTIKKAVNSIRGSKGETNRR